MAQTYECGISGLAIEFADEALTTHSSNWVVVGVDAGTCDPYRATCVVSHVVRGNSGWVMVEDGSPLDEQVVAHHQRHLDPPIAFPIRSDMRLSGYPYVTVRIACSRCPRYGAYRLARLADRYDAEMELPRLLEMLSADCKKRETSRINIYDRCGAYFQDLGGPRPPDEPVAAARPKLKVVR